AYSVKVQEASEDQPTPRLAGAFVPVPVTVEYKDYNRFPPVDVRALPHVTVRIQYVDSAGKPTRGHGVDFIAKRDGEHYSALGRIDEHGTIELLVPKGVNEAKLLTGTDP